MSSARPPRTKGRTGNGGRGAGGGVGIGIGLMRFLPVAHSGVVVHWF
jgi:hypothetical protein